MPDPALLKAIADAGGWAAFAVGAYLVVRALMRGDLVRKELLERTLGQIDKLTEALARQTGAVEALSEKTTSAIRELRDDLRRSAKGG